jgi:hypothetical protein
MATNVGGNSIPSAIAVFNRTWLALAQATFSLAA